MVTVSRPILHPFLAPIFTPSICSVLAPIPVQAAETPSFLPATAPTERLTSSITWLDNLGHRLMTNFTRQPHWPFSGNESCRTRSPVLYIPGWKLRYQPKEPAPKIAVNVRTSGGGSDHDFSYTRH